MSKSPFICAIVSDKNVAHLLKDAENSIAAPLKIIFSESDQCIPLSREAIEDGAIVLISRGSVWRLIKTAFPLISTLQIPMTCCDALEVLSNAKKYDTNIGVVAFEKHIAKMVQVAPYLGVKLSTYRIAAPSDIEKGCFEMQRQGLKVLVGGGRAVQQAQKLGMHGVLHTSSPDGVLQVLGEAEHLFNAILEERAKDARTRVMLNSLKESVMSLDAEGNVMAYNLSAERMFPSGKNLTETITSFLTSTGITDAVRQQQTWSGENKKHEKKQYICNITPVYSNDTYCGANITIQDATYIQSLEHKIRRELCAKGHIARYTLNDVVGSSQEMKDLVERAKLYANSPSSIFIYGESGTGKEIFAQGIHMASPFSKGPFVAINCTALPESLLESELFGYAEGAFTGARKGGKMGLFEMAHNGTLFLDEIGEIPTPVQAKLLRVLEEKSVMRIGQERYIPINVRIICATNKDLATLVQQGKFREDLFYRLNVLRLNLPPLRDHPEDIPELVDAFLNKLPPQTRSTCPKLETSALEALRSYNFPGNIRELRNIIERLVVVASGKTIHNVDISKLLQMNSTPPAASGPQKRRTRERFPSMPMPDQTETQGALRTGEKALILEILKKAGGNKSEAARLLGISPSTLWRKLKAFSGQ